MFNIGPEEIVLILVVALVFLGPNRLPEVARQIGKGLREFRSLSARARTELMDNVNMNEMLENVPSLELEAPPASSNGKAKKEKGKKAAKPSADDPDAGASTGETSTDGGLATDPQTVVSSPVGIGAGQDATVLADPTTEGSAPAEADADPIERSG